MSERTILEEEEMIMIQYILEKESNIFQKEELEELLEKHSK